MEISELGRLLHILLCDPNVACGYFVNKENAVKIAALSVKVLNSLSNMRTDLAKCKLVSLQDLKAMYYFVPVLFAYQKQNYFAVSQNDSLAGENFMGMFQAGAEQSEASDVVLKFVASQFIQNDDYRMLMQKETFGTLGGEPVYLIRLLFTLLTEYDCSKTAKFCVVAMLAHCVERSTDCKQEFVALNQADSYRLFREACGASGLKFAPAGPESAAEDASAVPMPVVDFYGAMPAQAYVEQTRAPFERSFLESARRGFADLRAELACPVSDVLEAAEKDARPCLQRWLEIDFYERKVALFGLEYGLASMAASSEWTQVALASGVAAE